LRGGRKIRRDRQARRWQGEKAVAVRPCLLPSEGKTKVGTGIGA